jgi:hypothetical protein
MAADTSPPPRRSGGGLQTLGGGKQAARSFLTEFTEWTEFDSERPCITSDFPALAVKRGFPVGNNLDGRLGGGGSGFRVRPGATGRFKNGFVFCPPSGAEFA